VEEELNTDAEVTEAMESGRARTEEVEGEGDLANDTADHSFSEPSFARTCADFKLQCLSWRRPPRSELSSPYYSQTSTHTIETPFTISNQDKRSSYLFAISSHLAPPTTILTSLLRTP
jgi:hypothetical protein